MLSRHICLSLPPGERRFWSPTLDLDLEPLEEGCRMRGYFGPHPNTWSMYLAGFAFLILVSAAALIIASSQWILGQPATALLALPVCLILLIGPVPGRPWVAKTVCAAQIERHPGLLWMSQVSGIPLGILRPADPNHPVSPMPDGRPFVARCLAFSRQ
jgi:hypothetical protein